MFAGGVAQAAKRLEFRQLGEVEVADLHCGYHHVKGLFTGGTYGGTELLHGGKHFKDSLIKAEIAQTGDDFAVLDEERAISRHAREHLFIWLDFADVPEARYQNAAVG